MFKKIKNKTKRNKKKTDAETDTGKTSSDNLDVENGDESTTESVSEAESSNARECKTPDSLEEGTQILFYFILKVHFICYLCISTLSEHH